MDSRVKDLWVSALESGEYKQVRQALRKGDVYCCLGVLCDLYLKDTGEGKWEGGLDADMFYTGKEFDGWNEHEEGELPLTVQKWAGLKDTYGELVRPINDHASLIEMNDNGMDFKQIAEVIKAQL